jgi:hypothetical protein
MYKLKFSMPAEVEFLFFPPFGTKVKFPECRVWMLTCAFAVNTKYMQAERFDKPH